MRWFYDMRTTAKLALSFAAMIVLMLGVGGVGLSVSAATKAALGTTYHRDMVILDLAQRAQIERISMARTYRQAMLSAGAQSQAASLEETAASLEELGATVEQNTDSAQEAAQLASAARDAAQSGGDVVSGAVTAMTAITRASHKIAAIITTIDEIAFQTNLLALNAAVEAARAGEQGRGFAVVAAEVRSLAQRTGSAAKEIRVLIADSSTKVEVGTTQVNASGKTLDEIVKSVERVTDMVTEIAAASREQNTGLEQVTVAVSQVDRVTQSNAAQTEELSATATSLSEKSSHLQSLVAGFRLGAAVEQAAPARSSATEPTSKVVRIHRGTTTPRPLTSPHAVR